MKNKTCGECKIARPSGLKGWMYCPRKHDTVLAEAEQCKTPYMTNGDKIRQMSDEELVGFVDCSACIYSGHDCANQDCMEGKLAWLKQEAKDE